MATLYRRTNSPLWWTAYFDGEGKRRYRSTGKRLKPEAAAVAAEMENRARRRTPQDDEKRRSILRLIEEAADMALRGTLTQASASEIINRMTEAATGEGIRQYGIERWFRTWLHEKTGSRAKGTAVRYEGVIESFIESLPPGKRPQPLGALSVGDIQRFRDQLLAGGRSGTTANIAIKILRAPLNLARRQGLIASNPAEAVDMVTTDALERGVFGPAEVAALIRVASPEWQGLILAGYYTGGRLGDLSNLQWSSVDLKRMTISFGQRKTKRFIEIPIHPELEPWLSKRATTIEGNSAVFPSLFGKTVGGASGLSCQFGRWMHKAGIVGEVKAKSGAKGRARSSHSFHSLRHSFNSAMANAGVPQELRQRLTGHASKAVNDRYTHTELETLRKAVGLVPSIS